MITGILIWLSLIGYACLKNYGRAKGDPNVCPLCYSRETAFRGQVGWRWCRECQQNYKLTEAS